MHKRVKNWQEAPGVNGEGKLTEEEQLVQRVAAFSDSITKGNKLLEVKLPPKKVIIDDWFNEAGARFISRFRKLRGNKPAPDYEWQFSPNGKSVLTTFKEADRAEVVLQWVRDGLTHCDQIAREMGLSPGQISKLATRLIKAGQLAKKRPRIRHCVNAGVYRNPMETKLEETNLETGWKRNRFYEGKSGNGKFRFSFPAYIRILGNERPAAQTSRANRGRKDWGAAHIIDQRIFLLRPTRSGSNNEP